MATPAKRASKSAEHLGAIQKCSLLSELERQIAFDEASMSNESSETGDKDYEAVVVLIYNQPVFHDY